VRSKRPRLIYELRRQIEREKETQEEREKEQ